MRLPCQDEYGVKRWRELYPRFHPHVQAVYKQAFDMYSSSNVWYDPSGEFTTVNFRHNNHPSTNLAEARVLNHLIHLNGTTDAGLCVAEANQIKGHDIWYDCNGARLTVNVKLAIVDPALRGVLLSETVRRELKRNVSSEILLVDNMHDVFVYVDGRQASDLFYSSHAKRGDRDVVFYDLINPTAPLECIFQLDV